MAGRAQKDAENAGAEGQGAVAAKRQEAAATKRTLLAAVGESLQDSQQGMASLIESAQDALSAMRGFAQEFLDKLGERQCADCEKYFGSGDTAKQGEATVSSEAITTVTPLDQAGLAMTVAAASAGGALFYLVVLRQFVLFGVIPLLSRIAHSEIYTNEARKTIGDLVAAEPGLCLNELVVRTGYSRNAVSYHLFVLEKEEELVSIKDGKYRRYFARNGKYVNGAKNVVSALRNETTRKMAQYVSEHPGSIQRELCVILGTTASAACWHAKRLEDLRVIRKERVANTVQYYPGEALAKYDLREFGIVNALPSPLALGAGPSPIPLP